MTKLNKCALSVSVRVCVCLQINVCPIRKTGSMNNQTFEVRDLSNLFHVCDTDLTIDCVM